MPRIAKQKARPRQVGLPVGGHGLAALPSCQVLGQSGSGRVAVFHAVDPCKDTPLRYCAGADNGIVGSRTSKSLAPRRHFCPPIPAGIGLSTRHLLNRFSTCAQLFRNCVKSRWECRKRSKASMS